MRGPDIGGNYGPYFQSQRTELYKAKLQELVKLGKAYEKDGAWWLRLEGKRSTVFDDHLKKEIEKVEAAPMVLDDLVRGRVERAEDRDFVLFRSNGEPVFHFVNVVDDIEMKITHVIRGEDHLSNTSKHLEIFKAFGVKPPEYAHIPLILKTDGPGKMSKRDRGALIEEYQNKNYLPWWLWRRRLGHPRGGDNSVECSPSAMRRGSATQNGSDRRRHAAHGGRNFAWLRDQSATPRWSLQIPPLVVTQIPPGRTI